MRTTWNIEDDLVEEVKQFAAARSIPAGDAASQMIRRGLTSRIGTRQENGFLIFDVPKDSPIVTLNDTLRLEDEL